MIIENERIRKILSFSITSLVPITLFLVFYPPVYQAIVTFMNRISETQLEYWATDFSPQPFSSSWQTTTVLLLGIATVLAYIVFAPTRKEKTQSLLEFFSRASDENFRHEGLEEILETATTKRITKTETKRVMGIIGELQEEVDPFKRHHLIREVGEILKSTHQLSKVERTDSALLLLKEDLAKTTDWEYQQKLKQKISQREKELKQIEKQTATDEFNTTLKVYNQLTGRGE